MIISSPDMTWCCRKNPGFLFESALEVIMNRYFILSAAILLLVTASSCSGHNGNTVTPDPAGPPGLTPQVAPSHQSSAYLWGLWEIHVDTENQTIDPVPLRGAMFTVNVTGFIDGPPSNLLLTVGTIDVQPTYTDVSVDVGLKHPFPGLDMYTGFDVIGAFLGDGSDAYPGTGGFAVAGDNDQQVLNPDGFTRWFNEPEFAGAGQQMPLLGYNPGLLGSPGFTPTAEVNPYKYFADGLAKGGDPFEFLLDNSENRGCFRPGSLNTRHYDLRFPNAAGVTFQYAVIAHWETPDISNPSLDDFPPEANSDEALIVDFENTSTIYYSGGSFGGNVILDITPWDWSAQASGVMDEYEIKCWSDGWTGEFSVDMTPTSQGDNWHTFHAEIPVETLTSNDPLPVWIDIIYPTLDYSNDLGISNDADGALAGYFLLHVQVLTEIPAWIEVLTPNGGEFWPAGSDEEITWDSDGVTGTVFIEYSKDDFVSDTHSIAIDEPNDGSCIWTIPDDPSKTVRVRITSTAITSIYDISDEDFSIVGSGWARTWGGTYAVGAGDNGYGTTTDDEGNIYVTGVFRSTVDFDPGSGTENRTSYGADDIFLSKFDISGTFQWVQTWGGNWNSTETQADVGRSVAVDDSGNVYVTGWFRLTGDFDPGTGVDNHTSNGNRDAFLSKFDSSGTFQWALTWGGVNNEYGYGTAVDDSGNVFATGEFWDTVDFDPGSGTDYHNANDGRSFLSKFDSAGTFQWARTWGDEAHEVAVDNSGNAYVAGWFSGYNVDFDPGSGTDNHTSFGWFDPYLVKYDSTGAYQWGRTWGGFSLDEGHGVDVDDSGNACISGIFQGTVDFDPGTGTDNRTSNGATDLFVSQFDSDGDFQWVNTWGGTSSDYCYSVAVDDSGNIFSTGGFMYTVDFDPGAGIDNHNSNGGRDIFLTCYDSTGAYEWTRTWGSSSYDHGFEVVIDSFNCPVVAGSFRSSADFAPSGPPCSENPDNHTSNGHDDAWVAKFQPDGCW